MSEVVNVEKAKEILENSTVQAKEVLNNPDEMKALLADVEAKMKELPVLGTVVSDLPVMVSLVGSYVTGEYKNISAKVILSVVGAFLYIVKRNDLIPDSIPVIGLLDDLAVVALALNVVKPELSAYTEWKNSQTQA